MHTELEKKLPQLIKPPSQSWQNDSFKNAEIAVDVLRLDLIHPIIGGNKWMKLKGFMQQALAERKAGIITKGGPWSNYVHACVWLCSHLNLECHIQVKGNSTINTAMLADALRWNAKLRFINRTEFYDETIVSDYAKENNLLYVPMGGADEFAIKYVSEFMQQLHLPVYDYVLCAVGTATTLGGLAFMPDNFSSVVGIDAGTNDPQIQQKTEQWQKALPQKKLNILNNYDFGGFAKRTPALIHFMNELYAIHQLPTDIVYTSKLFYATNDLAVSNYFPKGQRVLIIHSGGLQGNRSLPAGVLQF